MSFLIDLVARGTKHRTSAGSPEEITAAVFIFIGKGMKKVTGYTAQLALRKGQITGYRQFRGNIDRMRTGLFQFDMTAHTFGIGDRFKTGGIILCIHMAQAAFPF